MLTTTNDAVWPPQYTTRISQRAKRAGLRVTAGGKLEVVCPVRCKRFNVDQFLNQNKAWIIKQLSKFALLNLETNLPLSIDFLAVDKRYELNTDFILNQPVKLKQLNTNTLCLRGDTQNINHCRTEIKNWLKKQAKLILPTWIEELSQTTQLNYQSLKINVAKTRWGSCSIHKNINLNAKLLLLPIHLAQHVILHELCHTKHLNHSAVFWNLLSSIDKDTAKHSQQLYKYRTTLTQWLDG